MLEAVAHLALNEFQSLIASAAALPKDQSDAAKCCLPPLRRRREPGPGSKRSAGASLECFEDPAVLVKLANRRGAGCPFQNTQRSSRRFRKGHPAPLRA